MVGAVAVLGAWAAVPAATAAPTSVEPVASVSIPSVSPAITGLPAGMRHALGTESPAAASATFSSLWGVTCKHPGDCLGVGQHSTSNSTTPSADLWAGTSWRAGTLHLPGGATGGVLVGDSYAPNLLMAVGYYSKASGDSYPVDNIWTGNSWTQGPHQPAIPSGEKYAVLESISCDSSTFCTAAGDYSPSSDPGEERPLVEVWNGSSWRQSPPPLPTSTPLANLDAVSCQPNSASVTGSTCVVSGLYATSSGLQAWADTFDGEHWKNLNIPQPHGSSSNIWLDEVSDVSCSSLTSCAIVGTAAELNSAETAVQSNTAFAETLANGTWTVESIPPSGKNSELIGVDCLSATFCMADGGVGAYDTPNMGEGDVSVWNGTTWTTTLINPGTNIGSELSGIDCTSTTYCAATGTQGPWKSEQGPATSAFYNGTTWVQHTAP